MYLKHDEKKILLIRLRRFQPLFHSLYHLFCRLFAIFNRVFITVSSPTFLPGFFKKKKLC